MKDNQDYIIEADITFGDIEVSEGRYISTKDKNKLKDNQFLDPERRSFPIVNCKDVAAAPHRFGTYKGKLSSEQLKSRLIRRAKELGCTQSLPESWK